MSLELEGLVKGLEKLELLISDSSLPSADKEKAQELIGGARDALVAYGKERTKEIAEDPYNQYPYNIIKAVFRNQDVPVGPTLSDDQRQGMVYSLGMLNELDQKVLRLRYKEGLDWPEICYVLGLPRAQVRRQERQALRKLAQPVRSRYFLVGLEATQKEVFYRGEKDVYEAEIEHLKKTLSVGMQDDLTFSMRWKAMKLFTTHIPIEELGITPSGIKLLKSKNIKTLEDILLLSDISKDSFPGSTNRMIRTIKEIKARYRAAEKCVLSGQGWSPDKINENISIKDLHFSVRTSNCLRKAGIETLKQLKKYTAEELMAIDNFGKGCLEEVVTKIGPLRISKIETRMITC